MRTIALEESFWYDKLATEGSTVAHVRAKSAVAADWQHKLVDFTEYRLPDMDRNGVDMQVLSLTSPGIQVQPDPDIAVADARTANDFLADIIKEHPQRFAGLAAIPLQDPPQAADELRRAIGLGLRGALVNDHTLGHYLDEPQYAGFWETLQDLDVPLYIHPNAVPADNWKVVAGYPAMDTAMWSWAPRTGGHAMRLILGGVFDRYPNAGSSWGTWENSFPSSSPGWIPASRSSISSTRWKSCPRSTSEPTSRSPPPGCSPTRR